MNYIDKMINNPDLASMMSKQCYKYYIENMRYEKIMLKVVNFIKEIDDIKYQFGIKCSRVRVNTWMNLIN